MSTCRLRCRSAGMSGVARGSRLDERFSLLMCTTVFTFFHHSVWIPAGLSALFFLDKNTGLLFIRNHQHLALIMKGMGVQAWIIRITGG